MAGTRATFFFGSKERRSVETLGEAHALAAAHGDERAAAVVHQAIACIELESGFGVKGYP